MRLPELRRDERQPAAAVDELVLIGGDCTVEARGLIESAADAGLRVRWLAFDDALAQAAIASHGPGSVRLPLVIVAQRYCLQRPPFEQVEASLKLIEAGALLPRGCVRIRGVE